MKSIMDIKEIEKKLVKAKSGNYKICAWGAGYVGRNHGYDLIQKMVNLIREIEA